MPREKFKTLTEQMYYTLMALQQVRCGVDVMETVRWMTNGRIRLGPGTLYTLLGDFQKAGLIEEVQDGAGQAGMSSGKRSYVITAAGQLRLMEEHERHLTLIQDFQKYYRGERHEV
ncbi:MAG: PadR family transcriptional regulator [Firmicutes bacterium]|nr:PadR family transcriptional regulator [Bacillota bacterium]